MGDLVQLQKHIRAHVSAFQHSFEARYTVKPPITGNKSTAQLFRDGNPIGQMTVLVNRGPKPGTLSVDLGLFPEALVLFDNGEQGMVMELENDAQMLLAMQEYVLARLAELIEEQLQAAISEEIFVEEEGPDLIITPTMEQRSQLAWQAFCEWFDEDEEEEIFSYVAEEAMHDAIVDVCGALAEWFREVEAGRIVLPDDLHTTPDRIHAFVNAVFAGWHHDAENRESS